MDKINQNLSTAFLEEAKANRIYTAFAIRLDGPMNFGMIVHQ
jgi:hypothetical protein